MQEHKFQFQIDEVPYMVRVIPFDFNDEKRFRVSYNGGQEDIFVWDSDLKRLRAIDDDASTLPDSLGLAISNKIESLGY
jgi:hypothetical protein